jgi:hypothetical protein
VAPFGPELPQRRWAIVRCHKSANDQGPSDPKEVDVYHGRHDRLRGPGKSVLRLLNQYGKGTVGIDDVLDAVLAYDERSHRSSEISSMRDKYRRTLEDKPWLKCRCTFCSELGIHILIFRGGNRNKRRGAHNTAMLYGGLAVS